MPFVPLFACRHPTASALSTMLQSFESRQTKRLDAGQRARQAFDRWRATPRLVQNRLAGLAIELALPAQPISYRVESGSVLPQGAVR